MATRMCQEEAIFADFLRDTPPVHVKNLYNLYVYFWRWALWKVFENEAPRPGIISFITASSYLRGPGFAGMRKFMRETLDELWIIDLGGEGRGARKSENVFAIQTPVAIALAIRRGDRRQQASRARRGTPESTGTQDEKFAALDSMASLRMWRGRSASTDGPNLFCHGLRATSSPGRY